MIKSCLAVLLSSSYVAEAAKVRKANAVFNNQKTAVPNTSDDDDTFAGFNQTIHYDDAEGSYYGGLYVGTPLQGDSSALIAYDTALVASLIPSELCNGCPNKWFTQGSSDTYNDAGSVSSTLDAQNWVGTCKNATDTFCLDNVDGDTTSCASDLEFCLITYELEPPYEYAGALGLGLPETSGSSTLLSSASSFVMTWASEQDCDAEIIIDSNFADEDSYVYFGTDPLADQRNVIGFDFSSADDAWALNVQEVDISGTSFTDFSSQTALLQSSYQQLGVPSNILTDINSMFTDLGFICPSTSSTCATGSTCDSVAGSLPEITFTFVTSASTFDVKITSEVYLFQEENQCSTLITENTNSNVMFILGDPFFRNSTIALNYDTRQIMLFTKEVNTPIVPIVWPDPDENALFECELDVSEELVYTGTVTVGETDIGVGTQSSSGIAFDTRSTLSIFPQNSITDGWFDSTGYITEVENRFNVTLGDWEGLCDNMTIRVCLNDASSTDQKCVADLQSCLLYYSSGVVDDNIVLGVVGLGRLAGSNQWEQGDSWVQQNYLQNSYEPMATFMYHFAEDRTVTSNVHFGAYEIDVSYKLGNMSNYVDANGIVGDQEWAMRVNSASWGYFPTNTTFDNDVAILASNFDFLAVPTPFYQEIEAFLTRNNFTCEEEYPSDDIICAIQSDCDVVAPFLPTFSISFFDENNDTFSVDIPPSFYLLDVGSGQACMSLLDESTEDASFVLGSPFFRATSIQLNFNYTYITLFNDETGGSPIVPTVPDYDSSVTYTEPVAVSSDLVYSGSVAIGSDAQTSDSIAYDTNSRMTVISTSWFDATSAGAEVTSTTFTYTVGEQSVDCTLAYSYICEGSDSANCAQMGFCLTDDSRFPNSYNGMIGLGKWSAFDTEYNYIMQMYIQDSLNPEINIDLNFANQDSNIGTSTSSSNDQLSTNYGAVIGNTTSYSVSDDWALQVTNWTWNGGTYDPEEEGVSDIALLASSTEWLGVPEALYIDISLYMEYEGFTCVTGVSPQDSYCYAQQNCTDFVSSFPEFSMEFNNSDSKYTEEVFSVQIFPEVYLQQSEDGTTCTSLIRQVDSDKTEGFILGGPFFRNVSVTLNFAQSTIAVATKQVLSPIRKGTDYPYMDESKQVNIANSYMSDFGQYNGEMFVGEPPQGDGVKWAYSTSQYYSVVPSTNVDYGWYNSTASSTYTAENLDIRYISEGIWTGRCQMGTEKFCFSEDGDESTQLWECVTEVEFCMVTQDESPISYDFAGSVGFGKPTFNDYDALMASTIGHMWSENAYCPVATFDYNFPGYDSSVIVGCYNETENTVGIALSSSNSTQWALDAEEAAWGTQSITSEISNNVALLSSDYPYIAVPQELWTPIYSSLTDMGFVCFPSPFTQFIHCDIAKSCDNVAYELPDLSFTFSGLDGPIDITIPATGYLDPQEDDSQCVCLISQAVENHEGFILGAPFFRNQIITFDYLYPTISIFSKQVNSPIHPVPDDSDNSGSSTNLSTGAIVGISVGGALFLALFSFIMFKGCCGNKNATTEQANTSVEFPVEAEETNELLEGPTPNQRLNTESVGNSDYNSVAEMP